PGWRSRRRRQRDPGPARHRGPCGHRCRGLGPGVHAVERPWQCRAPRACERRFQQHAARALAGTARRPAGAHRRDPPGPRRGDARHRQARPGPARRACLAAGAGMSTPAEATALLFGDTLACEELRPAAFVPRSAHTGPMLAASGEALLRALAVVEDGPRPEEPESGDHALPRIEAKLDLLT